MSKHAQDAPDVPNLARPYMITIPKAHEHGPGMYSMRSYGEISMAGGITRQRTVRMARSSCRWESQEKAHS